VSINCDLLITVQNNKRCSVHVLKQLHNLPIMQDKTSLTSPRKNKHKKNVYIHYQVPFTFHRNVLNL